MRNLLLACAAMILGPAAETGLAETVSAQAGPVPGDERPGDRDAIRAHIDSIFKAYQQKDADTVRATHTPEWIGFRASSWSVIKGIDEYMKAAEASMASPGGSTDYEMLEFDVSFYGDMALVPYVARVTGLFGDEEASWKIRVLDVYSKHQGHWNQASSHVVLHPETQAEIRQYPSPMVDLERPALLEAQEAVWRAWFTHDREKLEALLAPEVLAISAHREPWSDREDILARSKAFVESGSQLVRIEFPETQIQLYGDVATLYSTYEYELRNAEGERQTLSGRATETFVKREGSWINTGWHLDSGP